MNASELVELLKGLSADKKRGLPLLQHPATRDRMSASRMRDLKTHLHYVSEAFGRSLDLIDATELSQANAARVKAYLESWDKKAGVIDSTLGTFRLLADLAREEGVIILDRPPLAKPPRHQLNRLLADGQRKYVKIARAKFVSNNEPYGLRYADWPNQLCQEYEKGIKPFFVDPMLDKRSAKRPASPQYMKTWLNRAERAFGFLIMEGVPKEELSFRLLADFDRMKDYTRWLYKRRGDRYTMTTKGDLEQWRHLAASYYEDVETGNRLTVLIRKTLDFVTVKDKTELVQLVHADDLYEVFSKLVSEAEHYEATLASKYGRISAKAVAAHKWMEAGIWGMTLVTWLRASNIAALAPAHLSQDKDGIWCYRFTSREMKSKRDHMDQIIDLWKGSEAQVLLYRVLEKVIEVRPLLVERFLDANPGQRESDCLFLNMKGRPYAPSALSGFFNSASVRYLGVKKCIGIHAVRTIVPTWLFVREGLEILTIVQRRLDHASLKTTQEFYLKVENLFSSQLAKKQMDERAKQKKINESLSRLPDELAALLARIHTQPDSGSASALTQEMLNQMLAKALDTYGGATLSPTLAPS